MPTNMPISGSPLNNPLPGLVATWYVFTPHGSETGVTRKTGVAGGENHLGGQKPKDNPAVVYALCLCPKCGAYNQLIFPYGKMLTWSKCIRCAELVPTESYRVITYGSVVFSTFMLRCLESRRLELIGEK